MPDSGALVFVVEWPKFGIAETSTPLDADRLQQAAERAHPVWAADATRPHRFSRHQIGARMLALRPEHPEADQPS